jgi:hypothetical protein
MHKVQIAERQFSVDDNPNKTISVKVFVPTLANEVLSQYECLYEIFGAGVVISRSIAGIDGFQCLRLALEQIDRELAALEASQGFRMTFLEDFPGKISYP